MFSSIVISEEEAKRTIKKLIRPKPGVVGTLLSTRWGTCISQTLGCDYVIIVRKDGIEVTVPEHGDSIFIPKK